MVENIEAAKATLRRFFPRTIDDKHLEPTSEETDAYNCIAWAMRLPDRWIEPNEGAGTWWPIHNQNIDEACSQEGLVHAFEKLGFQRCDNNHKEFFYDKVALYCQPIDNDRDNGWTHAARILSEEEYHSKAGESFDFHHGSGDRLLYNSYRPIYSYGHVYGFMKRAKYKRVYSYWLRFTKYCKDNSDTCKYWLKSLVSIKNGRV